MVSPTFSLKTTTPNVLVDPSPPAAQKLPHTSGLAFHNKSAAIAVMERVAFYYYNIFVLMPEP